MKRNRKVFLDILKKSRLAIVYLFVSVSVTGVIFYLYDLPLEPFIYVVLLILFLGIVLFAATYAKERTKAAARKQMIRSVLTESSLPPAYTLAEEDYGEVIRLLRCELTRLRNEYETARQDEIDYYTAWVHQIKTPIAVMRMELGGNETEHARLLDAELFRIEQYVDMVLQYIRLGSGVTDLVIKEYRLDDMIREVIHKFAPQFVSKRLRLSYEGTDGLIVTDKKWFACILEQIISNAVKYTPSGNITISYESNILKAIPHN